MKKIDENFYYCVEYDYDRYSDCDEAGCDSICRCSRIENARVTNVNIPDMVNDIYNTFYDKSIESKRNSTINSILGNISKEIDIYTIDRILRINNVQDTDNWYINVVGGYYGEEIGDVTLESWIFEKIEKQINEAFDIINLDERIKYLLMLEYGKILPELEDCKWRVETVEKSDIIFGSNSHHEKVKCKDLSHYSDNNYDGIRGVAIVNGDKFRLIDGYHRSTATEKSFVKLLIANK